MSFIFPPEPTTALDIAGSSLQFPVRRVYCVGRNYPAHAVEMGSDPVREPPFFFCKPADAVVPVTEGQTLDWRYPSLTKNLHPEIELVVAIGKAGIVGYAVGLDMTRRDLQTQMKEQKKPWEIGKAFDYSAPIGMLYPPSRLDDQRAGIYLRVNGVEKQRSLLTYMTWSVPEIIRELSRYFELKAGDLIMTGTPEGVGPVVSGDVMEGGIDGLGTIRVKVD